jgi:hypothetical protein
MTQTIVRCPASASFPHPPGHDKLGYLSAQARSVLIPIVYCQLCLGTIAWTILDSVLAAARILATLFHDVFCRKLMSIVLSVNSASLVVAAEPRLSLDI